jgi:exonuclease III
MQVSTHKPDVLVLQETKLQEMHVSAFETKLLPDYESYWTCSVVQKACFIRRFKQY